MAVVGEQYFRRPGHSPEPLEINLYFTTDYTEYKACELCWTIPDKIYECGILKLTLCEKCYTANLNTPTGDPIQQFMMTAIKANLHKIPQMMPDVLVAKQHYRTYLEWAPVPNTICFG